ncbi:hypothetical protein [Paenibacillus sp. NPDC057967]|uniref:hypothetical protein n=1 Tax=Paenibacillus sp. NPDC057967 TaxID=3346293 RepID=UPI0036D879F8
MEKQVKKKKKKRCSKVKKKMISSLLVLFAILLAVPVVSAQTSLNNNVPSSNSDATLTSEEQKKLDERTIILKEYFLNVEMAKAELDKLKEAQSENVGPRASLVEIDKKIEVAALRVEELKEKLPVGLEKIQTAKESGNVSALSSAADYAITEIQIFWDSTQSKYLAHTAGNFTSTNWKKDRETDPYMTGWRDFGGYDGYSVYSLHYNINIYNPNFQTIHHADHTQYTDWTSTASTYPDARGYAWKYQDKGYQNWPIWMTDWADYNNWRQLGWYFFDFVGGKPSGNASFSASFGHTWASTTINSISYPAGFGWSTNSNRWDKGQSKAFTF